jgi:NAD(P)-dependent dehydrogenase (short-subunit alcohol dehydrogenase family)
MTSSQQTVLITGANKGLGYETAHRLGELGWRILLGSRDLERGREAAEKLSAEGAEVIFVPLDVTSDDSVAAAVEQVSGLTDHLDVLINNAGIVGDRVTVPETAAQNLRSVYEVNTFGPVRVTHAFLPLLQAAENPRVVMVSSGLGSIAISTDPERHESSLQALGYPSAKAALNMITTQYAKAIDGVKFNVADPGYTATDLNGHAGFQTVVEGTDAIVQLATIGPDGPSGTFVDRHGPVPW